MVTIKNTNEKFGEPTQFTGSTLAEAVAEFQECITELGYGTVTESDFEIIKQYNIKNVGGEVLNLDGPLDHESAKKLADEIEAEHDIDVVLVEVTEE